MLRDTPQLRQSCSLCSFPPGLDRVPPPLPRIKTQPRPAGQGTHTQFHTRACAPAPDATTPGKEGSKEPAPSIHGIHGVPRGPPPPAPRAGRRRARRPLRGGVVRVPRGPAGRGAAEDAGLRLRQRRRLQAHPAQRRLLCPRQRQGALLLRRQQLLPAQRPEPASLRLLRHRRALLRRPKC